MFLCTFSCARLNQSFPFSFFCSLCYGFVAEDLFMLAASTLVDVSPSKADYLLFFQAKTSYLGVLRPCPKQICTLKIRFCIIVLVDVYL